MKNKHLDGSESITIQSLYIFQHLSKETRMLILLSELFRENKITREKLIGQLSALRKGTLLRKKNTYHCLLNKKWYRDDSIEYIIQDLYNDFNIRQFWIKDLISVIQLYSNRNYNYSLNYITKEVIYTFYKYFVYSFDYEDNFESLLSINIQGFPFLKIAGHSTECYFCDSLISSKDVRTSLEQFDEVIDFLHWYKKGNLTKIPKLIIT